MHTYTVTYPKLLQKFENLPIVNEQQETVCLLHKIPRPLYLEALNIAMEGSLPNRYETRTCEGNPLFQVKSTLLKKGSSYELFMPNGTVIPIKSKTVQLLETSFSFLMEGLQFRFEKDFTSTAYLYCNDEKIASARQMDGDLKIHGITYQLFDSDDPLFVALLATLYQALFAGAK